jgi:hypothetical protein
MITKGQTKKCIKNLRCYVIIHRINKPRQDLIGLIILFIKFILPIKRIANKKPYKKAQVRRPNKKRA